MDFNETYIFNKENQNIVPAILPEKEQYYKDLNNIEWGMTGRMDAMFANQFFLEAIQLIINSITLFEKGYFDCAFYSLRQSLEISTTTVYLADDTEENRKIEMQKWSKQEKFPMHKQMIDALVKRKSDFADIKEKMSVFFEEVDSAKHQMNKYVHKQGFSTFYSYYGRDSSKKNAARLKDFQDFLITSIGAVAVYRLSIDPLPVLLLDEEIYKRSGQFWSEEYSTDFIEKYIGHEHLDAYKQTSLYTGYHESLIANEEMIPSVLALVKDDFIEREKCEEILTQVHLLGKNERIAVAMTSILSNLVRIYNSEGYHWYWTNTQSVRKNRNFSSSDFNICKGKAPAFNLLFHDVFISTIKILDDEYYLEHNYQLTEQEIALVEFMIALTENQHQQSN
ncbi:hypothetical protein [Flavobacterium sp. BFFFF1]|uniref:hypothetical protein n=1 Tax=Flavobacterium sp. BFFFF1 TaxID=2015557 RepID=UPI0025B80779|nr:hypothetical protein [Flavobacterium sp. BFFFF1]